MGKHILIVKGGANGSAILAAVVKGFIVLCVSTVGVYLYLYPVTYCVAPFYGNALLLCRLCA